MKSVRIFIQYLEDAQPIAEPQLMGEYQHASFNQQIGMNRTFKLGSESPDIEPNGQRCMLIKLWTGCESFETFNRGNV